VPDSIRWYADGERNDDAAPGSDATTAGDVVVAVVERRDEGHDEAWW
jgi:hypothetical protein